MNNKQFPDRYARSGKSIRVYKIRVFSVGRGAKIIREYGQFGGKLTLKEDIVASGKNIGKSNETTPYEQALRDAEGYLLKKSHEGYKTLDDLKVTRTSTVDKNVPAFMASLQSAYIFNGKEYPNLKAVLLEALPKTRTDKKGNTKPMKAVPFYKFLKYGKTVAIKFPAIGQPKINGVRAFLRWNDEKQVAEFTSKNGLAYNTASHIVEGLTKRDFIYNEMEYVKVDEIEGDWVASIFQKELGRYPKSKFESKSTVEKLLAVKHDVDVELVYDGELYIDGEILSEISSAVKKLSLKSQLLQFHTFDLAIPLFKQDARIIMLRRKEIEKQPDIVRVQNIIVKNEAQAIAYGDSCIEEGWEGAIFRDLKAEYGFGKRTSAMAKFKRRESAEFEIVDVKDSDKAPGLAIFTCRNDKNVLTFDVVPEGTFEQKQAYFNDRYNLIGKKLTVEFYERTKNELPFHAVGIAVRDYE